MSARIRITRWTSDDVVAAELEPKMMNLGNAIGRRMQRTVPKRTWALHDTITNLGVERRGARLVLQVGAGDDDVNYALYVERGTSKMEAQPYMRPALNQSRSGDLTNTEGMGKSSRPQRES